MKNSESVVKNLDVSKKQPTQNYKNKSFSVYFSVLRMGGDIDVDKLNARKRLIILLIIDSLIVFFSIFVCYEILEPYFKNYSPDILIISAIVLLLSHHVLHTYLIYIIEPGNTRVSTSCFL